MQDDVQGDDRPLRFVEMFEFAISELSTNADAAEEIPKQPGLFPTGRHASSSSDSEQP
ncbi:hypothetical protein [Nocardia sp. CA-119907]|uniref:hypothetical protein n=1 Tax=Nocardia sp. CA-119907 TaxID=3239973 RepID=UPI003D97A9AC